MVFFWKFFFECLVVIIVICAVATAINFAITGHKKK